MHLRSGFGDVTLQRSPDPLAGGNSSPVLDFGLEFRSFGSQECPSQDKFMTKPMFSLPRYIVAIYEMTFSALKKRIIECTGIQSLDNQRFRLISEAH